MSDILETESNAVITVKKTFNQFVNWAKSDALCW